MKEFLKYVCLFVILILVGVVGIHLYGIDTNSSYFISEKELSERKTEMLEKSQVTVVYTNDKQTEKALTNVSNFGETSVDTTNAETSSKNTTSDKTEYSEASISQSKVDNEEITIEIEQKYSKK